MVSVWRFSTHGATGAHSHIHTHTYIQIAIQNGIRSANPPGSTGLIAQLILIFSHLPVHTYTHMHEHTLTHTHKHIQTQTTHTFVRSFSLYPPFGCQTVCLFYRCVKLLWNEPDGRQRTATDVWPSLLYVGYVCIVDVGVHIQYVCMCMSVCLRLNVCSLLCVSVWLCAFAWLRSKYGWASYISPSVCHVRQMW